MSAQEVFRLLDPTGGVASTALRRLGNSAQSSEGLTTVLLILQVAVAGTIYKWLRKKYLDKRKDFFSWLFPSVYVAYNDPAFMWILAFLAQDPAVQKQLRHFQLSTEQSRDVRKQGTELVRSPAGGNNASQKLGYQNASWAKGDVLGQMLPTYHMNIVLKFNGQKLWVHRATTFFARGSRNVDHLVIKTYAWKRELIKDFIVAAHDAYFAKADQELLIIHANRIKASWQPPVSRPSRPWSSVILPPGLKEGLLSDMEKFLSDKEVDWYGARGIPHRRGYLFHGEPGSGKTTLATALASKLRLDIYVINPSQRGMDDAKLSKLFRVCPAKSVILIEDIDCIFPSGGRTGIVRQSAGGASPDEDEDEAGDGITEGDDGDAAPSVPEHPSLDATQLGGKHDLAPSTVTLSGLLNAIDGVSSQEGCVLIASTNHPEKLDPALCRPGRFDVRVGFGSALPSQARALFLHFYPLEDFNGFSPDDKPDVSVLGECGSLADLEKIEAQTPLVEGRKIQTQADIDALADAFVEGVFPTGQQDRVAGENKSVSMAALQGYLIGHKENPFDAAEQAARWAVDLQVKQFVPKSLALGGADTRAEDDEPDKVKDKSKSKSTSDTKSKSKSKSDTKTKSVPRKPAVAKPKSTPAQEEDYEEVNHEQV